MNEIRLLVDIIHWPMAFFLPHWSINHIICYCMCLLFHVNRGIYDFKKENGHEISRWSICCWYIFPPGFKTFLFLRRRASLLEMYRMSDRLSSRKKFESKIHHISIEDQGIFGREKKINKLGILVHHQFWNVSSVITWTNESAAADFSRCSAAKMSSRQV